jgi:hypothetical protein
VSLKDTNLSAEEVTAKVPRALTEVSRNCFQECFLKIVTAQGNYFEGNVVKQFWKLFEATCVGMSSFGKFLVTSQLTSAFGVSS